MKIWFYCSYFNSPVGFQLGFVNTTCLSEHLEKGTPHRLLERCFSYQGVKEAYGKIPGTENYVAVRPISGSADGRTYLNFGFETNSMEEFRGVVAFLKKYRDRDVELFQKLLPGVSEDPSDSTFGIRINIAHLKTILQEILSISNSEDISPDYGFFIQTKHESRGETLTSDLFLPLVYRNENYSFIEAPKLGDNWFQISEKKKRSVVESSEAPYEKQVEKKTKACARHLMGVGFIVLAAIILVMWFFK